MKKLVLVVLLLSALTQVGCGSKVVPPRSFSGSLQAFVTDSKEGTLVDIRPMSDFGWEKFYVFGPYTSTAVAEKALGFSWPEYKSFGLERSDHFNLMVFTTNNQIVRVEQNPRCRPDFAPGLLATEIARQSAVFVLQRRNGCALLYAIARLGAATDRSENVALAEQYGFGMRRDTEDSAIDVARIFMRAQTPSH